MDYRDIKPYYQDQNCTIYHGECLEVMSKLPDNSIDAIITDPPYGTTQCKWDTIIPLELLWKQYKRIVKDNGVVALMGSEPFSSYLRLANIKMYKYDWIWNKVAGSNFLNLKNRPLKTQEQILIFSPLPEQMILIDFLKMESIPYYQ